jgi:hypothetical protein
VTQTDEGECEKIRHGPNKTSVILSSPPFPSRRRCNADD